MAWLALWWKVVGYAPLVTRSAMLVLAAFSLLGLFRLAERVASTEVAIASTLCTALYPVFFAQSSLAHVDLAAAGFIFWGLSAYVEERWVATAVWFGLAALSKETAILAPLGIAGWEVLGCVASLASLNQLRPNHIWLNQLWLNQLRLGRGSPRMFMLRLGSLTLPALPLALWYLYHFRRTGYVFGNPEFFRYNIASTLSPLRFLLALAMRLWQVGGYLHLWILTLAMLLAMWLL